MHGGASLKGIASPSFKHGIYSKHLPPLVAQNYEESLSQEEAKALSHDIAVTTARVKELLGTLQSGERGTVWDDLQAVVADLQAGAAMSEALPQLQAIAEKGKTTVQAWREIGEWVDRKARLVQADARRANDLSETATREQMQLYVASIVRSVREHVIQLPGGQAAIGAIAHDIEQIGRRVTKT